MKKKLYKLNKICNRLKIMVAMSALHNNQVTAVDSNTLDPTSMYPIHLIFNLKSAIEFAKNT